MNPIKIFLMLIAFSLESSNEILLLKYKIPYYENNTDMFLTSVLFDEVYFTYTKNDFQFNILNTKSEFLFMRENQTFYIMVYHYYILEKILEDLKMQQQSCFIFEFGYDERIYKEKPTFQLVRSLNQTSSINPVKLRNEEDQLREKNIKNNLLLFDKRMLDLINRNGSLMDAEFFRKHAKFELLYFSTHLQCFEALKSILSPSNFLEIIEYDCKMNVRDEYAKKSYFTECLEQKFKEDSKNLDKENYEKLYFIIKYLIDDYFVKWINLRLLLPIVSNFSVAYHFDKTYEIIFKFLNELQNDPVWSKDRIKIKLKTHKLLEKIFDNLREYSANELFKYIETDITILKNCSKSCSQLYGKKEDYNISDLEKIVCDYSNIMESIIKGIKKSNTSQKKITKNMISLKDCKDENLIVEAFRIFYYYDKIQSFKAYNFEGQEITLTKNSDYFIFGLDQYPIYVFPFEIIRKHRIDKIEVIFQSVEPKYFSTSVCHNCENN